MNFKHNIFVPFNVPSLKNSKVATSRGVFPSKTVRKYLQALGVKKYSCSRGTFENYKTRPNLFEKAVKPMKDVLVNRKPPHVIGLFFIRDSRRKFDISNAQHIILDLLTAHQVISDDNADILISMPVRICGSWYDIDKEHPGCRIYFGWEDN